MTYGSPFRGFFRRKDNYSKRLQRRLLVLAFAASLSNCPSGNQERIRGFQRGWWAQLKLLSGTKYSQLALVIQSNGIVQPLLFSLFCSVELVMPMLFPMLLMEPGLNLLIAGRRGSPIIQIGRKTESRRKAGVGGRSSNDDVALLINFLISCVFTLRPYRKIFDSSITRWKVEVLSPTTRVRFRIFDLGGAPIHHKKR